MSILLKALKQAATDRDAARRARPATVSGKEPPDAARADREGVAGGTDTVPARSAGCAGTVATHPMPVYGGLWITLVLAVISAGGFGYWMRGMSSTGPRAAPAESIHAAVPPVVRMAVPGSAPSALTMHDAGPLQLRLDRHLDTLPVRAR